VPGCHVQKHQEYDKAHDLRRENLALVHQLQNRSMARPPSCLVKYLDVTILQSECRNGTGP